LVECFNADIITSTNPILCNAGYGEIKTGESRNKKMSKNLKQTYYSIFRWVDKNIKYFFTLPTVFFILIMIVFPLGYTFSLSFFEWSMSKNIPMSFVKFSNYTSLFSDERFLLAIVRTLAFSAFAIFFEVVIGVSIAIFLSRQFFGKNLVKTLFLLPMVATPVAIGMVWTLIYEPTIGLANFLLQKISIAPLAWLGSENLALIALAFVDIWQWTPMVMLITLAGVSALPDEPFESARVDGATNWQILWKITLPLLRPTILVAVLLRLIDVLKTFDILYATTQGGPGFSTETLNIFAYKQAFEYFQLGKASAVLVIFFAFVLSVAIMFIKYKKKTEVDY
jgi:multiple sugar transport system permease protein